MLSWWSNIETVAIVNGWLLGATIVFSILTVAIAFLNIKNSRRLAGKLSVDLEFSTKQVKSLKKTAKEIRKELLQTQQHQDISQIKLKSSKSSTQELRQALLDAQARLKAAEAAIKEHEEKAAQQRERDKNSSDPVAIETLDLELEPEGSLTENQREQLIDLLDPGPKGNIDIFCVLDDDLSELTASQLELVLAADGWKTSAVARSAFANPPKGLVLAVNSKDTAPSYASFLQRVFTTIGMPVSPIIDKKYREWSLTIIVGTLDDKTFD